MNNSLFRYRSVDKRTIEGLERNEFYFASPTDFNDPFDCKNLFSFDGSTDSDFRLFLKCRIKHMEPNLSAQEINEKVEAIINNGNCGDKKTQAKQLKIWGDILEEESNKLGIVCFSKKHKDILMWSLYSDKHRGICLEFDKDIIESRFFCGRVHYSQNYPTFKKFVTDFNKSCFKSIYKLFLLTKSKHWKYEKEYRLIDKPSYRKDLPGERLYKYPAEALIGVIWGCQTLEEDKEKIKTALKSKKHSITYSQARKSENSYSIKVEKT